MTRSDAGTRRIRVTTLVDSLLAGGAERVAVELACALDRSRFEPRVIVTRGDGPLRSLLDDAGVPLTMLERDASIDVGAWRRAHRELVAGADVLHAHKFGSNAWGALLSRTAGIPLVAHEHNFSEAPSLSRRILDRHWIARRASRIVCVSDSVAEVERSCGIPERLLEVVPNGVRLDAAWPREAARAELGIATASFTIGIVGRLRPEKAHEVLLEAVAQLSRRGRDVRLCVVGDGPRRSELQLLAARLGIDGRITWAGERRDAATLAAAFDAAVVCSHWEGLPLAALESMAAGVPLVATRVGGLPALLDGDAGLLVPPADADALAAALDQLMTDPLRRAGVSRAGRERVASRYSFQGMVDRMEAMYADVAAEPVRRRVRPAARGSQPRRAREHDRKAA